MKIRINDKEKIDKEIALAQGKSRVRTLSHERLVEAVEKGERQLKKLRIAQKYWKGSKIRCEPEAVCNSYNKGYPSFGTWGRLERFPTGWFVTDISRTFVRQVAHGSSERNILRLADTAKAAIPTEWYTQSRDVKITMKARSADLGFYKTAKKGDVS